MSYGKYFVTGILALSIMAIVIRSAVSASSVTNAPVIAQDFSKFKHDNPNHARLPCLLCHRRESNESRPAMPGGANHAPCAGCHEPEFANSGSQICTICHTNVQSGAVKPFPRLASFGRRFDHARHLRVRCASCHRPVRGGNALSIPSGFSAHSNCYGCHSPRAQSNGRDISSCGTCHTPARTRRASQFAPAFRLGFSHAEHDKAEGLTCNECHRIGRGQRRVGAPQALNHHAAPGAFSCMSCHDGKRAFGGDDFSVCKRCHTGATWRF